VADKITETASSSAETLPKTTLYDKAIMPLQAVDGFASSLSDSSTSYKRRLNYVSGHSKIPHTIRRDAASLLFSFFANSVDRLDSARQNQYQHR
jgi:hypothetical protein